MGENSGIQWTTHTFNPWVGCQRVSPGCEHCYAESYDKRVGGGVDPKDGVKKLRWGPKAPRVRTSVSNWNKPLKWNAAAKAAGERHRVFCSSLADVFEDRPELVGWRFELFALIRMTPHLDWLLLTKRPENVMRMIEECERGTAPATGGAYLTSDTRFEETRLWLAQWRSGKPPANVWQGTTVEDQRRSLRVLDLVQVPAVVHFLSMEPLLEEVELPSDLRGVDWIIIGGESGGGARPFHLDWARSLVRQARSIGAAPFVKQLGACASDERNGIAGARLKVHPDAAGLISRRLTDATGGDMAEWPEDLRVREFPR